VRNGNWCFKDGPDDIFVASGVGQRSFVTKETRSVGWEKILQWDRVGQFLVILAGNFNAVKLFDMAESIIILILQLDTT
jgi:hypothetical protein